MSTPKRPARTVQVQGNVKRDGFGVLILTIGDTATEYGVERIAADFGYRAFNLVKRVADPSEEVPLYSVILDDDNGHSCDCKGGTYSTPRTGKPCKHVAALEALRDRNLI